MKKLLINIARLTMIALLLLSVWFIIIEGAEQEQLRHERLDVITK